MSAPTRPSSAPPQPLSHTPTSQTSKAHHVAAPIANPNPFLPSTRPRIDQPSTQSSSPISIADRARSMSTSSLVSPPVGDEVRDASQLRPVAKAKDMFSWFTETIVISQIVRNWPS